MKRIFAAKFRSHDLKAISHAIIMDLNKLFSLFHTMVKSTVDQFRLSQADFRIEFVIIGHGFRLGQPLQQIGFSAFKFLQMGLHVGHSLAIKLFFRFLPFQSFLTQLVSGFWNTVNGSGHHVIGGHRQTIGQLFSLGYGRTLQVPVAVKFQFHSHIHRKTTMNHITHIHHPGKVLSRLHQHPGGPDIRTTGCPTIANNGRS